MVLVFIMLAPKPQNQAFLTLILLTKHGFIFMKNGLKIYLGKGLKAWIKA